MTADKGGSPGNGEGNGPGNRPGGLADIAEISDIQIRYIQEYFRSAVPYTPTPGQRGGEAGDFLYRQRHLLTRDRDLASVLAIISEFETPTRLTPEPEPGPTPDATSTGGSERFRGRVVRYPIPGLALVRVAPGGTQQAAIEANILFPLLEEIERQLGPGIAGPDHLISVTPATYCPATEPDSVPRDCRPQPGVSRSCCDGRGTRVAVVDTGLLGDAPFRHPWMHGIQGEPDPAYEPKTHLLQRYAGHGTFISSIVRAMAPRAEVRVQRIFKKAGAIYESGIVKSLLPVLDWAPDVISLSAGSHTWKHHGLLSFHVFVDGPLRECPGTVLVAAAGNDGRDWKFAPAEMDGVLSVGALGPPGDARAWFSNYGDWVQVYAPGQDLVHAYASRGTYHYREAVNKPDAKFHGMASWSGTSFSTPVVSGLIAARMSGTGESSHEAAQSLLTLARAQALPGVGPVLRPGQACLCACGQACQEPPERCDCGGHRRC